MTVLPTMLHPYIVQDRIKTLIVHNTTLQSHFGMGLGGGLRRQHPSRSGVLDVFDETRNLPTATTPGTHSVTRARFPVAQIPYVIPRSAENLPMPLEEINQLRPIGGPAGEIDELGARYIMDQETNVRQTYVNLTEFQVSAMLRGSYSYTQLGDGFWHGYSGGNYTVDYQVPSGNKTQLDMLGAGDIIGTSWANAAAPIIRDLLQINAALIQLTGLGLRDIFVTSAVWGNVITNTEVQNLAGSSNNPVQNFTKDATTETATATLSGAPWVTWHINDHGLAIGAPGSESFTKLIGDTAAVFLPGFTVQLAEFRECPEPVVDPVSQQLTNQYGEYYYHKFTDDPVCYEFHSRYNGLPLLKIRNSVVYGTVVF